MYYIKDFSFKLEKYAQIDINIHKISFDVPVEKCIFLI